MQNNPQDKVQTRRRPRKQARPQKCISGTLPHRWDKTDDQTLTTSKPSELYMHMEPITLSINNNHSKGSGTIYVMATTTSKISFQIMRPMHIQWQPMKFTITLKTPCPYTRPNSLGNYTKFIPIYGLHTLTRSNAYFYFRPAPDYQNILIEGPLHFHSVIKLRLTTTACYQPLLISKGTCVGTLHPVLLTHYVEK